MSKREKIRKTIERLAAKAARNGSQPNLTDMAIRLSSHNPQSGMTLQEIEAAILDQLAQTGKRPDAAE